MKKLFLILPAFALLMACGEGESYTANETVEALEDAIEGESFSTSNDPIEGSNRDMMIGSWTGENLTLEVTKTQFTLSDSASTIVDSDYQLSYKDDNTDLSDQIDHGHIIHLLSAGKTATFNILSETDFNFSLDLDGENKSFKLNK